MDKSCGLLLLLLLLQPLLRSCTLNCLWQGHHLANTRYLLRVLLLLMLVRQHITRFLRAWVGNEAKEHARVDEQLLLPMKAGLQAMTLAVLCVTAYTNFPTNASSGR